MTVRLGPVSPAVDPAPPRNPRADGYGDNPRCLRRDISNYLSSRYTRTEDIVSLITTSRDIATFQNVMQGGGFGFGGAAGGIGVHAGGHFTIAGDPAGDFYTSPNDPAFWLHHAMIDRTWTIWQSQDLAARTNVIAGGTSMMGFGGRMQSLDDLVDLGVVGDKVYKIRDLVSVVDGPFCYVYE
jgi:tyrosinase